MESKQQMREDFGTSVRAIEKSVRPWKIATVVLSLVVVVLAIVAVLK